MSSFVDAFSKIPGPKVTHDVDAVVPKNIALKLEAAGVKKGKELDLISMFILAVHAGVFVGFGAGFFTIVSSGMSTDGTAAHFGLTKFAAGISFCTGLSLVILAGSELFTGNAFLIMAWLTKKITTFQMFKNLIVVYIGNYVGSIILAAIQLWARCYEMCNGVYGVQALAFAQAKCGRYFGQCYALGILCNVVVCWAVWMALSGRTSMDKLLVFILPITAFAAQGFEHCVANMYFLPLAFMIKTYAPQQFWQITGKSKDADYGYVNIGHCIAFNQVPATLGNWSGSCAFLGCMYWYLYLRDKDHVSRLQFSLGSYKVFASPPPAQTSTTHGLNIFKTRNQDDQ